MNFFLDHGKSARKYVLGALKALYWLEHENGGQVGRLRPTGGLPAREGNTWQDQSLRGALAPLAALAQEQGTAVLLIAHLNKGRDADPLRRLGGSIGLAAAARSLLLLARDPDDPEGENGARRGTELGPRCRLPSSRSGTHSSSGLRREARDGIMRAWLEILRERHPGTAWITAGESSIKEDPKTDAQSEAVQAVSAS